MPLIHSADEFASTMGESAVDGNGCTLPARSCRLPPPCIHEPPATTGGEADAAADAGTTDGHAEAAVADLLAALSDDDGIAIHATC